MWCKRFNVHYLHFISLRYTWIPFPRRFELYNKFKGQKLLAFPTTQKQGTMEQAVSKCWPQRYFMLYYIVSENSGRVGVFEATLRI